MTGERMVNELHIEGLESRVFEFERRKSHRSWFRGDSVNFNPAGADLIDPARVADYVLHGWRPAAPVIGPQTQVTAFGSCFAGHVSEWLSRRNYRVLNKAEGVRPSYVVEWGEGMVNSFVIRQQFEWAWENRTFDQPLWHGYDAEAYGYREDFRQNTKALFDATDVFILTFGLSEVWYDEPTGNVFWRTIPKRRYDPARHRFRVSTVDENRDNIRAIYDLIRRHRPDARIIVTLSPVPLIATFRDVSCITANSVSKAVLRVAIDEVLRAVGHEGVLHYWPSYEIVTDVLKSPYKADRRHITGPAVEFIMTLFEHAWCSDGAPKPSLAVAWARAAASAGLLPEEMAGYILRRQPKRLRRWIASQQDAAQPTADPGHLALAQSVWDSWEAERGTDPETTTDSAEPGT
jgi:hypothetical protein